MSALPSFGTAETTRRDRVRALTSSRCRTVVPLVGFLLLLWVTPLIPADGPTAALRAIAGLTGGVVGPAYALALLAPRHREGLPPLVGGALAVAMALAWLVVVAAATRLVDQPLHPSTLQVASTGLILTAAAVAVRRGSSSQAPPAPSALPRWRWSIAVAVALPAVLLAIPGLAMTVAPITAPTSSYAALALDGDLARLDGPVTAPSGWLDLHIRYRSRGDVTPPRRLRVEVNGRVVAQPLVPAVHGSDAAGVDGYSAGGRQLDRATPLQERRLSVRVTLRDGSCLHRVTVKAGSGADPLPGQLSVYASSGGERARCADA